MAKTQSDFPATIDATLQTDRASGDTITSDSYDIIEDALFELETKVGVDSSEVTGSIDYKVSATRLINLIYPVGCIYVSTIATNPGTLFGVGTWEAFGAGRVLVGLDAGQAEFDTVEETGGAKTHALSVAELAAHNHPIRYGNADTVLGANYLTRGDGGTYTADPVFCVETGSGSAHNNLQPYIVCYFWKRTV